MRACTSCGIGSGFIRRIARVVRVEVQAAEIGNLAALTRAHLEAIGQTRPVRAHLTYIRYQC